MTPRLPRGVFLFTDFMKLSAIAAHLQITISADAPDPEIHGAASLQEAGPEEISFFGDPRYLQSLKRTKAAAVLLPSQAVDACPCTPLVCENPAALFSRVLELFRPPSIDWKPGVHPMAAVSPEATVDPSASIQAGAVIEAGAIIGADTVIGANSYVGHRARLGSSCFLHPRVTVGERCVIGNRVILHSGVVIGSDGFGYEFADGRQKKIPQTGIVQIDDDVEIGANSTVDRARFGRTHICEGVKLDNLVQIGHNVVVGPHSILCAQVGISGSTRLGRYVVMAGKVGVAGHLEIGDQVTVAAMAGISGNLKEGGVTYSGMPAIPMRDYKRNYVRIANLDKLFERVKELEKKLAS